jgi:uncharacterized protein (DUF2342 family)
VIHCTLRREREKGERKVEVEVESPAGDRARGVVCEESPVFRMKAANVCDVKARQWARSRRERRRSMSDGKGEKEQLKKVATSLG